jgi:hypothetical protein
MLQLGSPSETGHVCDGTAIGPSVGLHERSRVRLIWVSRAHLDVTKENAIDALMITTYQIIVKR